MNARDIHLFKKRIDSKKRRLVVLERDKQTADNAYERERSAIIKDIDALETLIREADGLDERR